MEILSALVTAAQNGDVEAFDKIVVHFQDMAYASAYSMLGDAMLAEDVAQEAFIEAYLNLPKLRIPAAFPGWLRRIVFKQGDRLIRGKHLSTLALENVPDIPQADLDPAVLIVTRETSQLVRHTIENLPEHLRTVTLLFYSTGYSLKDIAAFLEVPVTTVKKRLFDARQHLREDLLDQVRDTWHQQRRSILDSFPVRVRLLIAVRTGDMSAVETLLQAHPLLINMKTERNEHVVQHYPWLGNGLTPLYEAAASGNVAMVNLLLGYGANVHTWPYNALHGATQYNHKDVVKLLLKCGANVDARSRGAKPDGIEIRKESTSLRLAAMKGYTDIVVLLLRHGAFVDARGPSDRTSLHWAALKGHHEIVKLLLESDANRYLRDELGRTSLDWARVRGQKEVVDLLSQGSGTEKDQSYGHSLHGEMPLL